MKTWKEERRMSPLILRRRSLVESNLKRLVRKDAIFKSLRMHFYSTFS
jgi:hypothetical protein